MLAGFVDGRGRAYDIGFRTLRFSLVDEDGLLVTAPGEAISVQESASASMDLLEPQSVPLLRPSKGELIATLHRIVFIVAKGFPRKDPFTFFNVGLSLHPSAIEHFFLAQGGREFVLLEKADIITFKPQGARLAVEMRGPAPGTPSETARFLLRIEPRGAAEAALSALE